MALPFLVPAVVKFAGGVLGAAAGGVGAKKKRRRRARLTHGELMELVNIKNILGKSAAASALPYYMGRGR